MLEIARQHARQCRALVYIMSISGNSHSYQWFSWIYYVNLRGLRGGLATCRTCSAITMPHAAQRHRLTGPDSRMPPKIVSGGGGGSRPAPFSPLFGDSYTITPNVRRLRQPLHLTFREWGRARLEPITPQNGHSHSRPEKRANMLKTSIAQ